MSVIIWNAGYLRKKGDDECMYTVQINQDPPLAWFTHHRNEELAVCLERAAKALREAGQSPPKQDAEVERLREIEHAAHRAVCSYFNALDNNDTRLARMQDLSKALLPRRCG